MAVRIQFRRGTSAEWSSANPVLAEGELGFESDTKVIKFGDGSTAWSSLPVAAAGDITAVIAGTGLTGGATSGQATLAIDTSFVVTASSIDAPGDLIVGAGPDTYARLPVGPSGSVLVADPSQSVGVRWAAASSSSGAVVPTGTILPFAGTVVPAGGFLLCNGQPVLRSQYAALFNVIGTTYTLPSTSPGEFNLPNLTGRVPVGFSSGDSNFGVFGNGVGDTTTVLVGGTPQAGTNQVQVPSHGHDLSFTGTGEHGHTATTEIQDRQHSHGPFNITGGNHRHDYKYFNNTGSGTNTFGIGAVGVNSSGSSTNQTVDSTTHTHQNVTVPESTTNHQHSVNIPTSTGTHSHAATVTNSLPNSTNLSRVQPSLVINYIIKT